MHTKDRVFTAYIVIHYRNERLCRRPKAVGLGPKSRRLSLTRRLFYVVGIIGRRVGLKAVELAFSISIG
jgi:hypothetical protein